MRDRKWLYELERSTVWSRLAFDTTWFRMVLSETDGRSSTGELGDNWRLPYTVNICTLLKGAASK